MRLPLVPRSSVRAALAATAALLPVLAVAGYGDVWTGGPGLAEMVLFGPTGAALLTGHWGAVFADPVIQGGPLELVPFGAAQLLHVGGTLGWAVFETAFLAVVVLCVLAALLGPLGALPVRTQAAAGLAVGAVGTLGRALPWSVTFGHPAEALVPCLWVLAARAALRRDPLVVGALLGVATLLEPWGLLGAPVALCAARPDLVRSALAGAGVLAAGYGPFVATGRFRMFGFHWGVADTTLVHALWPALAAFPWPLRLLQAVVALAVGAGVALALREHRAAVWCVPLAVLLARLLLDPLLFPYYLVAPSVVALAAAVEAVRAGRLPLAAAALGASVWFLHAPGRGWPGVAAALAVTLLVPVLVRVRVVGPSYAFSR